jgi:multidrug efflux pump subunit AcrA (membrane-fusion protein)
VIRKYVVPCLAALGLAFAIWIVMLGRRPQPAAPPVAEPALSPFPSYVAGAGIVEPSTQDIAVGTPVAGLVAEVLVQVGHTVEKGAPLFKLDDRALRAELEVRQKALHLACEKLTRLVQLPRPEDMPPAVARLQEAQAALADAKDQLRVLVALTDKRGIRQDDISRRQFAVRLAEAKWAEAQAQLALLKAGSWQPDIAIAQAEVEAATAQVQATQTDIERLTVRAPVAGEILQVNIRVGEFAATGALPTPLLVMGDVNRLHVRVDIDENEAWRIATDAPAMAFVRGNRDLQTPLQMVRIEPYIVPKRSLTNDGTERVDTRVLQVRYSFERGFLPVYVGQQMDVFIQAPALGNDVAMHSVAPPQRYQTDQPPVVTPQGRHS